MSLFRFGDEGQTHIQVTIRVDREPDMQNHRLVPGKKIELVALSPSYEAIV